MKITKSKLKQLIKEELQGADAMPPEEDTGPPEPDFSEYELNTMDTDHQTVALLKEILAQLKTLNQYMTPAKGLSASAAEKALAGVTVAERKRN